MDQYPEGRISPIALTSPTSSPYTSRLHRRDRTYTDRYGSLDVRQSHEHKSRDKFSSLDRTAAMSRYGYRDQRDRSVERSGAVGDYTAGRSSSLQRNRSLDRDYPLVSMSMRSLATDSFDPADPDSAADLRCVPQVGMVWSVSVVRVVLCTSLGWRQGAIDAPTTELLVYSIAICMAVVVASIA